MCLFMINCRFLEKKRYLCSANALRLTNNIINAKIVTYRIKKN